MKKYQGGCHCCKFSYEVEADLSNTIACNCSICTKRGSILAFTPETNFTLKSGANDTTDYLWNKKVIHHLFCKNCGILSYAKAVGPDGINMVAINVRCLDDVDLSTIKPTPYDGRSR